MNRRDVLKGMAVLPSITLGSLVVGNAGKGIAESVSAVKVSGGKYLVFADPQHVDLSEMTGAMLPPGFDHIEIVVIPVKTCGRPIDECLKIYKVEDRDAG